MSHPLYNLSECDIFCTQKSDNTYQVDVWTKCEAFIGSTQLNNTESNVYVPDGIVARRGYGRSLHRLLIDIATDLGGSLAIVRDGDARGGALTVWSEFYTDTSLAKINIESHSDEIDWTSPEEDPQLFHAYQSSNARLVEKVDIQYRSSFNTQIQKLARLSEIIFERAYEEDSNHWIEKEYPIKKPISPNFSC